MGHTADIKALLPDFGDLPADLHPVGPARVREGLQHGQAEGARRRQGQDLRHAPRRPPSPTREALDKGSPGCRLTLQHKLFDKLVYSKLRAAMGGKVAWAVSGGAPLGARLGHFFRGIGVTILEGYGLTETTAAGTVNTAGQHQDRHRRPPLPRRRPSASPTTARS